jgi:Flp pilus assembly protein TadD
LGTVLVRQGQTEPAISEARRALELSPESSSAYNLLLDCLSKLGRDEERINVARPGFPEARSNFRLAIHSIGKTPDGVKALPEVESLAPNDPVILGEMAWFFATQSDATLRNGNEAVRLAEHASALMNRPDPKILATLAAAYAEAARIPDAIKVAEEARLRAQSGGDAETVGLSEKLLASFQKGHAYQEEPAKK